MNHQSEDDLLKLIAECPVIVGSCWRHYKGARYRVCDITVDEDGLYLRVSYHTADLPGSFAPIIWSRPLASWLTPVVVDGKIVPRYALMADA